MVTSDTEMKINLKKVITAGESRGALQKEMSSGEMEGTALQGMSTLGGKDCALLRSQSAALRQPGKETAGAGRGRKAEQREQASKVRKGNVAIQSVST